MTAQRRSTLRSAAGGRRAPKSVRFDARNQVHTVPRGGRNMEPGFVARVARRAALKLHGVSVGRRAMNDVYGNGGGGAGTGGRYTDLQSTRDQWHHTRYGMTWYTPARTADGKMVFLTRYTPDAHRRMLDEMLFEFQMGRAPSPY